MQIETACANKPAEVGSFQCPEMNLTCLVYSKNSKQGEIDNEEFWPFLTLFIDNWKLHESHLCISTVQKLSIH